MKTPIYDVRILVKNLKKKCVRYRSVLLFLLCFLLYMGWIEGKSSQMAGTGDAESIWKTITTFYSEERYASYVLYKGFASVYPYVWFYQAAVFLRRNELFFVMIYHALLFSFVTVVGIPMIISRLLRYEAKFYQRILLPIVLFIIWYPTGALSQVIVDLPSCSGFIAAACCSLKIKQAEGHKKLVWAVATGLLSGYVANISGQYSIAAGMLVVYAVVSLIFDFRYSKKKGIIILSLFAMLLSAMSARVGNIIFEKRVIEPFREQGIIMSDGEWWRDRALVCMLDKGRPDISTRRGIAILESVYGEDVGKEMLQKAVLGDASAFWTPQEYLRIVCRYPIDFMVQYIDRLFLALSHDWGKQSAVLLSWGYLLLWMFMVTIKRHYCEIRSIFSKETWFIFTFFASIIAPLVMTMEMRYALSIHALIYGIALLGPLLPDTKRDIGEGVELIRKNGIRECLNLKVPWGIIGGFLFICFCLSYMGALYSQSDLGVNMLYCK